MNAACSEMTWLSKELLEEVEFETASHPVPSCPCPFDSSVPCPCLENAAFSFLVVFGNDGCFEGIAMDHGHLVMICASMVSLLAIAHRYDLLALAAVEHVTGHGNRSHPMLLSSVDHIVRSMSLPLCSISDKIGISMGSICLSTAPLLQKLCVEKSNLQNGGARVCL